MNSKLHHDIKQENELQNLSTYISNVLRTASIIKKTNCKSTAFRKFGCIYFFILSLPETS